MYITDLIIFSSHYPQEARKLSHRLAMPYIKNHPLFLKVLKPDVRKTDKLSLQCNTKSETEKMEPDTFLPRKREKQHLSSKSMFKKATRKQPENPAHKEVFQHCKCFGCC